jgi:hypothetical protein
MNISDLTLENDPLAGQTGYRVQTNLQAGDCSGGSRDGCEAGTQSARDLKGNAYCAACEYGAP